MVIRTFLFLCLLVIRLIGACSCAMAQSDLPLSVEDALRTKEFAQLMPVSLSPDGEWLAFTVKDNRRSRTVDIQSWMLSGVRSIFTGTDISILNVNTGVTKVLTGEVC